MKVKKERFIKLAKTRMDKLIKYMRLVGNLSNKQAYEYSNEEKDQIVSALELELKNLKQRFEANSSVDKKTGFNFK